MLKTDMTQTSFGGSAPVVEVTGLRVRYGDLTAVDGVSFSVARGEIFGILGPNGAGKTTTVECIGGLREPTGGSIRVLGLDPLGDRGAVREQVGIQLQTSELPDKLKVREALALFASFYRDPDDPMRLLELLDLESKRDERFANLSGGQRQRLSIALALIGRPRVAILDELTTGLDPAARRETWNLIESIRDQGVTVLLVTHFMDEAERLCDRIAVLDHGRLVALDTPAALATGAGGDQRLRFRPSAPVDERRLTALPEVSELRHHGDQLELTGSGNLLAAVIGELVREGIAADQLRFDQANLEDAFVALTSNESPPDRGFATATEHREETR
ncbi:MAG TPA: ABC transporter ATP-binding protein [Solirubrobacteraceae bacterium]|jgi:ABC-2 type transport system ATP-binding protein